MQNNTRGFAFYFIEKIITTNQAFIETTNKKYD